MARPLQVVAVFVAIFLLQCSMAAVAALLTPPSSSDPEISDERYDESPFPAASSSSSTRRQLARILARIVEESQSAQPHQHHRGLQPQSILDDPDLSMAVGPNEDELIADIGTDNGEIRQWSRRLVTSSKSDDRPLSRDVPVNSASSSSLPAVVLDNRGSQLIPAVMGRRQRGTGAAKRGPGVCINSCLTGGMTFVRCKSMCH